MSVVKKIKHEARIVGLTTLFFASWFTLLILLKHLVLAEHDIDAWDISKAIVGALVVAKVVVVLENVRFGSLLRGRSGAIHIAVRTLICMFGVLLVLLAEHAINLRHEQGGILPALRRMTEGLNLDHVLATTLGVAMGLLLFNLVQLLKRHAGDQSLIGMLAASYPETRTKADAHKPCVQNPENSGPTSG